MMTNNQTKDYIKRNREITLKTCKDTMKAAKIAKWLSLGVGVASSILGVVTQKREYFIGTALSCTGSVITYGVEERCNGVIKTLDDMADYFFEDDILKEDKTNEQM